MSWRRRVHRRLQAERDIEAQVDYYLRVQGVPAVAMRFIDAVEAGFQRIVEFSEIGFLCDVDDERLDGLRQWPVPGFSKFFIFYLPTRVGIDVVRVIHSDMDRAEAFEGIHSAAHS